LLKKLGLLKKKLLILIKIRELMISEKLKKGNLLIAEPSILGDLSFNRSVVLLADHNPSGSVGFILNKPLQYTVNDLVPEVEANFTIYNGIFWGGDFEKTRDLINNGTITKDNIRFFLGYTGWDANQLESEMNSNAWILIENNYKKSILKKSSIDFWKEQILELGGEYLIWSNAPENPTLN